MANPALGAPARLTKTAAAAPTGPAAEPLIIARDVDQEPRAVNERAFGGATQTVFAVAAVMFSLFHLLSLNVYPLETWTYRILHIAGALTLGFAFFCGGSFRDNAAPTLARPLSWAAMVLMIPALLALIQSVLFQLRITGGEAWNGIDPNIRMAETWWYGAPLLVATAGGIVVGWFDRTRPGQIAIADLVLMVCGAAVASYLVILFDTPMRQSTGSPFAPIGIALAAIAGVALILEMTRRVAGLALVVIAGVFLGYVFLGPSLPRGLLSFRPIAWSRFFSNLYTDAGVLGPTTAVSSTYIILFVIFAAFLQVSKVGDYFVNFAFALAGRARGGPAKVAVFASGLMGMINGTSAGNVVATGSLTIPLMKRVGYPAKDAGAVEAAASTGGQIMPPIMGAGAFIMAEVTAVPYQDIAIAAIIPAILYFASVYFMVDFTAARLGMRGIPREQLPRFGQMARQAYLFVPIVILIVALFLGYSVIRAGALAMASAAVVSWLSPHAMGPRAIFEALRAGAMMSIQIIAVCACAGIIVGVISLTGVDQRLSNLLLDLAADSQFLALVFTMIIAMILGMGMPTTAAYAVAASVVAPGLEQLGIDKLTAHFFVFYYAVVSAITPPVALAGYAAAGISGANPMATSVASFRMGLAAYIVPFMFFYAPALLMNDVWWAVLLALVTATIGVSLLASSVVGWYFGRVGWGVRVMLLAAALCLIKSGAVTDVIGLGLAAVAYGVRFIRPGQLAHGQAD